MLKELNHYENLGTPKFFHELFSQLSRSDAEWKKDNVREYFYNRIIDNRIVFDGCLPLAEAVGAIEISPKGLVVLNPSLQASLVSEGYLCNKLLEMILSKAKEDDTFYEIFCSENISYDIIYRLVQINNAAFGFEYANFRQLLVSFGFLFPHPDKNIKKFIVSSKYKKLFDRDLMPEIKRKKIGIGELEKILEQKQIYGREAENFVVGFEKKRLAAHPNLGSIEMISDYDIGAGYDVVSYENEDSPEYDRFIEVKSFSGIPSFHWSNNEINVSRIKRGGYFLYLVDRDKMHEADYIPRIIKNPHKEVIEAGEESVWEKRVEGYFIIEKAA